MNSQEQKAYQRGYRAGRTRRNRDADEQAFFDRALIACLPTCIEVIGWQSQGTPITNLTQRTELARDFAIEALEQRRRGLE